MDFENAMTGKKEIHACRIASRVVNKNLNLNKEATDKQVIETLLKAFLGLISSYLGIPLFDCILEEFEEISDSDATPKIIVSKHPTQGGYLILAITPGGHWRRFFLKVKDRKLDLEMITNSDLLSLLEDGKNKLQLGITLLRTIEDFGKNQRMWLSNNSGSIFRENEYTTFKILKGNEFDRYLHVLAYELKLPAETLNLLRNYLLMISTASQLESLIGELDLIVGADRGLPHLGVGGRGLDKS